MQAYATANKMEDRYSVKAFRFQDNLNTDNSVNIYIQVGREILSVTANWLVTDIFQVIVTKGQGGPEYIRSIFEYIQRVPVNHTNSLYFVAFSF